MPGRGSSKLLPLQMFFQADEALVPDDDVVDQLDVEDAAGLHKLPGRLDVLLRRRDWSPSSILNETG